MKRFAQLALGALALTVAALPAAAQEEMPAEPTTEQEGFFGKPAFVIMPSAVITPVLSGVGDQEAGDTKTYFNARFMTVIPTRLEWLQFVAGTQWLPNGPRAAGGGGRATQPNIFYGTITPFTPLSKATGGWLNLSFDVLGLYGAGLGGTSDAYGHDLVLEGAAVVPVGAKLFPTAALFGNVSAFALLDQVVTHAPIDPATGDRDYWNPVALAGIVIPVGK